MSTQFVAWLDAYRIEWVTLVPGQRKPTLRHTEFWGTTLTMLCQCEDELGHTWTEHLPAGDVHTLCTP